MKPIDKESGDRVRMPAIMAGPHGAARAAGGRRRAAIWALACCVGACSILGPRPTTLAGSVSAGVINVGTLGRASPVIVRIYQLKSATAFEAADFLSLYEHDRDTLRDDLLDRQELVIQPGASQPLPVKSLNADARVLGVIAAFQDLEHATWRATAAIRPNTANRLAIRLEGMAVRIVRTPDKS